MARPPRVPRLPPGRFRDEVPLVVPDPVVDLPPVDDNPPVIDDEVPVPVPVDVPVIAVAPPGEMEQMRTELRATSVARFRDPNFNMQTPVLPIPAMNGLKGMCVWAAYHKARDSNVTFRDFTQEVHDDFLARYLEMRTEDSRDTSLMQKTLITSFPKNFNTTNFITVEKNLRSYLETQRSPYSKTPLSYLLRSQTTSLKGNTRVSTRS
jgi:hypothetical protein